MLVVGGEGNLLSGKVDLADAALEAGRVVDVAFAPDDFAFHLLVALLALHLVAVKFLVLKGFIFINGQFTF